jgi:5-methyltetrahydrofolate--homocysteine methyltransferase
MATYLEALAERVVVFDGATGTNLQLAGLSADDFGGPALEGCNEVLVVSRPDVVRRLHASFLEVGVDVVETDTFGAFATVLAEYGLAERAAELNLTAARLAREVASDFTTPDHPRFVAGSMGPGTKLPSLGQIGFATLRDAYEVQAAALLEGGVDLLVIETCYDLLQAKAAVVAARAAMRRVGREVPLQVQVTMELTGRMLVGTEIGAALTALEALRPDVLGLNCATGPTEMGEHLRHLSHHARTALSCLPNAGLPSVVDGAMHYDLTPEGLADHHTRFVTELGVSVIGGCCGTTPAHLAEVVRRCRDLTPARREIHPEPGAASLYTHVAFDQDTALLTIGERANANGSKRFREAMLAKDWETCVTIARDQVREGAHLVDVCVDYTGSDGVADMTELAGRLATASTLPLVVDTTEAAVAEAALRLLGGRAVLNSVNLEDGDAPGTRLDRFLDLARTYGAAVICTCIDQRGQARTAEWKLEAAQAIYDLATTRYGLEPSDLFFDPLALPLSTGMEESRRDGIETLEGIRRIKAALPGVHTVVGLSNVSFGLNPAAREALNSVFLHECQQAGLDAAILHAGRIVPLSRLDDHVREVCLDLVHDRRRDGYDPLAALLAAFEGATTAARVVEDRSGWPVERRLERRIVEGERIGIEAELDEALEAGFAPLSLVNDVLLAGMKTVGELFASGEMQLPFVLASAETMKAAVSHLEPRMPKSAEGGKGRVVLATVKGDVHDIGKNLVDIILTNNGYEVHNLGIKVGLAEMLAKADEVRADALGMSGLLVKSTLVMRENLEELNALGRAELPVLLGGAALTRTYVERDLRAVYQGRLFYGKDAFEGLRVMERLMDIRRGRIPDEPDFGRAPGGRNLPPRRFARAGVSAGGPEDGPLPARSPEVASDNEVPKAPFVGSRVAKGIPIEDVARYLNETALYRNQWGFRPEAGEDDAAFKARVRSRLHAELDEATAAGLLVPQVAWGYFPANAEGDDLVLYTDEDRRAERVRFHFPRQRRAPHLCIADFFRSVESGEPDWAAFHVVTMGPEVSQATARLFAENRYTEYLLLHGLGVEMAEALAELWHRRIREEWGFADEDGPSLGGLFRQQYRGGRYSWGYPACPDLEDNAKVADLLEVGRIGVSVSEGFQLHPEQTTSAIICHHPQAKYFVAN